MDPGFGKPKIVCFCMQLCNIFSYFFCGEQIDPIGPSPFLWDGRVWGGGGGQNKEDK